MSGGRYDVFFWWWCLVGWLVVSFSFFSFFFFLFCLFSHKRKEKYKTEALNTIIQIPKINTQIIGRKEGFTITIERNRVNMISMSIPKHLFGGGKELCFFVDDLGREG